MDHALTFGQWLKQRRKDLLLTQESLAKLVGCAAITIRKIEADELRPSAQIAAQLARRLELEPDEQAIMATFARTGRRPAMPPSATAALPVVELQSQPQGNLPVQRERLIGREADLAAVRDLLLREDVGLVTLTGVGGAGKTRLALEVATQVRTSFADDVWFVELAPISDAVLLVSTIAAALGFREAGGQPPLESLKAFLHPKQILLVLDNFEQIVAAAPLLADLLKAAPRLKIVVTSRVLLHLYGEQQYAVPPLALPDLIPLPPLDTLSQYAAVSLFIHRARAVKPNFHITTANAPAIAEICARLDGLPLALELAAARVRLFPPPALLARLTQRLTTLTGGARDLPERHQTLRAAIDWSYNLLAVEEQRLFARLGVFVGGCTLEAVEAVCGGVSDLQGDVLAGLASLVDQSLVHQQEGVAGEPRFTLLETLREYALERLEVSGESEQVRTAYAAYYANLVETAEPELEGHGQPAWLQRLAADHDNIRTVLAWSCTAPGGTQLGLRVAGALSGFWWRRGFQREARRWLERLLAQEGGSVAARAKALLNLATMTSVMDEYALATRLFDESLARFRELDDHAGIARALLDQGRNLRFQGDYSRATLLEEESLALFQRLEDRRGVMRAHMSLGDVALDQGDVDQAQHRFEEAKALGVELGNLDSVAWANINLGCTDHALGDDVQAKRRLEESLAQFRELDNRAGLAMVFQALGHVAHAQGESAEAADMFRKSVPLAVEVGSPQMVADSFAGLVEAAATTGQTSRAARLSGSVMALLTGSDVALMPIGRAGFDRGVADARAQLDEPAWEAAVAEGRAMTLEQAIAYALEETPQE